MSPQAFGSVISTKDEHPSKALSKISADEGMLVTLTREVHCLKADWPIAVVELGMVIEVRELQCANANWPMDVTVEGIQRDTRLARGLCICKRRGIVCCSMMKGG